MNLRALILFAVVLLLQAGLGMAFRGSEIQSGAEAQPCQLSCCEGLTVAEGCCCIERPASVPAPSTPTPPPAQGRSLVPLILWTVLSAPDVPDLWDFVSGNRVFHADAAQALRAGPASLAVLHCSFLI